MIMAVEQFCPRCRCLSGYQITPEIRSCERCAWKFPGKAGPGEGTLRRALPDVRSLRSGQSETGLFS